MQDFIPWLMNRARGRNGLRSDRSLARNVGMSEAAPATWRNGNVIPHDEVIVKLCVLADFPPQAGLLLVNILRTGGKPAAIYGKMLVALGYDPAALMSNAPPGRNAA